MVIIRQIICSTILLTGSSVNGVSMMSRPGAEATDHPAMNGKLEKNLM